MSVPASQNEISEAEALRRAQRAHEPSMEEILASIRAIIADDREPAPAKTGPQIVYSSDAPRAPAAAEPPPAPTVVWNRNEEPEAPLLAEETEAEVAGAFASLSETMAAHGREVAEGLAREMLRPMLKEWLDANLPAMVERLVRAEIERVARGKK